jgi:hypothetical protein
MMINPINTLSGLTGKTTDYRWRLISGAFEIK